MEGIYKEFFEYVDKAEKETNSHAAFSRAVLAALSRARERIEQSVVSDGALVCEKCGQSPGHHDPGSMNKSFVALAVHALRKHRWCGDAFPENGWPDSSAALAQYELEKRI